MDSVELSIIEAHFAFVAPLPTGTDVTADGVGAKSCIQPVLSAKSCIQPVLAAKSCIQPALH